MECPTCYQKEGIEVPLKISHRTSGGPGSRVSRGTCDRCLNTHVIVQFVSHVVTDKGTGAHSVAKRMEAGELGVQLIEADPAARLPLLRPSPDKRK